MRNKISLIGMVIFLIGFVSANGGKGRMMEGMYEMMGGNFGFGGMFFGWIFGLLVIVVLVLVIVWLIKQIQKS